MADANAGGPQTRLTDGVDDIVQTLQAQTEPGDIVLILSNGGFGGIYARLPEALAGR